MAFIIYRKLFYALSALLVIASLAVIVLIGFSPSIEFTGGSLLEVQYPADGNPSIGEVRERLEDSSLNTLTVQAASEGRFILRFEEVSEETHQEIVSALGNPVELRFETIGPIIGRELTKKSLVALIISVIAMFIYIWIVFRKVGGRIKAWKMSASAIIALMHDVTITTGAFVLFAWLSQMQTGVTFIVAILTIWGYSINDTIVVFDRMRENIGNAPKATLKDLAGQSIKQTLGRSINTGLAVFVLLFSIFILGPVSLRIFIMPLLVGVVIGTYSSICIALPLLLDLEKSPRA